MTAPADTVASPPVVRRITGASLRDRAGRPSARAMLRCLGYSATIACAALLAACNDNASFAKPPEYGVLRMKLYQQCMDHAPDGPKATGGDNDWDELPDNCANSAYYVANSCDDPKVCLAALEATKPQGAAQ